MNVFEEDNHAISPQYLNDIDKDCLRPTSDHMMGQFAKALEADKDYIDFLAGVLRADMHNY